MIKKIPRRVIHYVFLPLFLILSDILLMFVGHFSATTSNEYTWQSFLKYISELNISDFLPALVIAIIVVLIVEWAMRSNGR